MVVPLSDKERLSVIKIKMMILIIILILNINQVVALAETLPTSETNKTIQTMIKRSEEFENKKQYDDALNELNELVQLFPTSWQSYEARGLYYLRKDKYDLAIQDYNKEIEIKPDYLPYYRRGLCYKNQQKYALAVEDYKKALTFPMSESINEELGDMYNALKQYDLAIEAYGKAINYAYSHRHFKSAAEFYNKRGELYQKVGDLESANKDFAKYKEMLKNDKEDTHMIMAGMFVMILPYIIFGSIIVIIVVYVIRRYLFSS